MHVINFHAPCGLRGCKNKPAPGRMSYKVTKPGLVSVLYISMCYTVLLLISHGAFLFCISFCCYLCSVFWLFWLSYQYLPSDWLERLLWGSLIVARGSSPESPGRGVHVIFLVYCIASFLHRALSLAAHCIVIGPVCGFVCVCVHVCVSVTTNCVHRSSPNWVCR